MNPQQHPNINGGQDSLFPVTSPPTQLSLSYPGERNGLPEMGPHQIQNGEAREEREEKSEQVKVYVRGHWRAHEDAKLKELVALNGPQNWNEIAEQLPGRSGKSCRLRWCNQLDPRITKGPFTAEEENRLLVAHRIFGNKWAHIARFFLGRSDNAVKNHWHVIMARRARENNSVYNRRRSSRAVEPTVGRKVNVCGESGSMCTELPLPPSSPVFDSFRYLSQFGHFGSSNESKNQTITYTVADQVYNNCGPVSLIPDVAQPINSDSNSEITAADSDFAKTWTDFLQMSGNENGSEANNIPYFDFLGVGPAK